MTVHGLYLQSIKDFSLLENVMLMGSCEIFLCVFCFVFLTGKKFLGCFFACEQSCENCLDSILYFPVLIKLLLSMNHDPLGVNMQ